MIQHNGLNLRYNQVIGMEHDETLSGDGSNQSPLGVMWSSLPNDVVKSADIADMATTGDIDSLVTSIAETYQTTAGMTAYQSAGDYYSASNPSGFITEVPVGTMNESAFGYDGSNVITSYNGSAFAQGGSAPTYGYTDNDLISAIDTSGLYATSALKAVSANAIKDHGILGYDLSSYLSQNASYFYWMPSNSPWTTADYATGIFSPLQYSTGACLAMNNPATFKGFYKGNEWFVSNTNKNVGQMLRGEVHASRGVHISGATTAGYGFDLSIHGVSGRNATGNGYNWKLERGCVSGKDSNGEWRYGYNEDAALRAVSSCDMHESAFSYDASDNITAYNGSAFKAGDEFPQSATEAIETVTANSADWNETTETVSSNSGAWGGSALPISAGPGIKFEMVDNTLVASTQGPILDEITIAGTWNGREVKQMLLTGTFETNVNSDVIPVNSAYSAASSKWIDPSNSYIQYGSTANILPSTWVLGATGRLGSLSLLNGIVRVRSNDTTNTQCTAFVTIKWCEN